MSFLRFTGMRWKRDRRPAWYALAEREGGEVEEGKRSSRDRAHFRHGPWLLVLDTYTLSNGQTQVTYTRLRAIFRGYRELKLTVRPRNALDRIWASFGFGALLPLSRLLLDRFVVKGKPAARVPSLFSAGLTDAFLRLDRATLRVKRARRKERKLFGEAVGEVTCEAMGVVTDVDRLAGMVAVVRETLDSLQRVGEADRTEMTNP